MPVITLTSDWGNKDYYTAAIKGEIISQLAEAIIIDISHEVPNFDIIQASFIIRNAWRHFPKGTVHIIAVDSHAENDTPHVALEFDGHYFIGTDNGLFSLAFDKSPGKIVELTISQDTDLMTFPAKDLFVKAACHIARGGTLEVLGKPVEAVMERTLIKPVTEPNLIKGSVFYIDAYGNAISNITKDIFREAGKSRPFSISFGKPGDDITTISRSYNDVVSGERLAIFGASGYLEISINKGNASKLLGLHTGDVIRMEFR